MGLLRRRRHEGGKDSGGKKEKPAVKDAAAKQTLDITASAVVVKKIDPTVVFASKVTAVLGKMSAAQKRIALTVIKADDVWMLHKQGTKGMTPEKDEMAVNVAMDSATLTAFVERAQLNSMVHITMRDAVKLAPGGQRDEFTVAKATLAKLINDEFGTQITVYPYELSLKELQKHRAAAAQPAAPVKKTPVAAAATPVEVGVESSVLESGQSRQLLDSLTAVHGGNNIQTLRDYVTIEAGVRAAKAGDQTESRQWVDAGKTLVQLARLEKMGDGGDVSEMGVEVAKGSKQLGILSKVYLDVRKIALDYPMPKSP